MPDIVERMLDSIRDYTARNDKEPMNIYLGWYEMHEFKTSSIFPYYNYRSREEKEVVKFHNFFVYEVNTDSHLNIA